MLHCARDTASSSRARPQLLARDVRAQSHGLEFLPDYRVMHLGAVERLRGKVAIRAGHHILAASELGEPHDTLGNQLRCSTMQCSIEPYCFSRAVVEHVELLQKFSPERSTSALGNMCGSALDRALSDYTARQ